MNTPLLEIQARPTESRIERWTFSSLHSKGGPCLVLALSHTRTRKQNQLARMLWFFGAIVAFNFILRIFYAGHLFVDDGLWFTVAEEILRGKALYREIYFDKPPVLPLIYAALFKVFGVHIVTIRIFTIVYSSAISIVLYSFGSRLYGRRAGMLAAVMFTFFSTTSVNNHTQGLNTDFLMLLPYTAGAYLFIRANFERRGFLALIGGILVGVAVQTNPKATFDLIFFALIAFRAVWCSANDRSRFNCVRFSVASEMRLLALAVIGFAVGTLPLLAYLMVKQSLLDYWLFAWDWGSRYAAYSPAHLLVTRGIWLTATYLIRNNTLLFALIFVVAATIRRARLSRKGRVPDEPSLDSNSLDNFAAKDVFESNAIALLWLGVSCIGLAVGGRFYSNYFFQILPGLCLVGAHGLIGIISATKSARAGVRRAVLAILLIGFMVTFVRFHTRTVTLALGWMRGTVSRTNAGWYHEQLNREERMVASVVRELPYLQNQLDHTGVEAMRNDSPRIRAADGSSDYLFVWGSSPGLYYWPGLIPASRYLSAQPLTGVPADVQHSESTSILDDAVTAAARAQLIRDLEQTRPLYIVDGLGFFNARLSILSYPELGAFMENYESLGLTGRFLIYRKKRNPLH